VDIIRKYEPWLAYWASEPDKGQYEAINKGFAVSSGRVMAWLNSDDMYVSNSFSIVGSIFATLGESVQWITGIPARWDENDVLCGVHNLRTYECSWIRLGLYEGRALGWMQQESTFWSRDLWIRAGGFVKADIQFAADFDLWRRFACHADLYSPTVILGGFRLHNQQKTALNLRRYYEEVDQSLTSSKLAQCLNKLVRNRLGQRIFRLYEIAKRGGRLISYNSQDRRWEIVK
jgi:hypothetical protein